MEYRNLRLIIVALAVILFSSSFALALGVSIPYTKNNPLEMYPGHEREVLFNLQNCPALLDSCDGKDMKVSISLTSGSEIAEIAGKDNYNIKYGSSDKNVGLKILIPETAKTGDEYPISFSITPVSEDSGATVQLGVKYNVEFPVIIKDESSFQKEAPLKKKKMNLAGTIFLSITLFSIIALIILVIIYRISNRNKIMPKGI